MLFAILTIRALANAVGEGCLQDVEILSGYIPFLIDHWTCQMLPHALPHDSGLSVIHAETLFEQDGGSQGRESVRDRFEFFAAGKCKIVGVAGVFGADGLCQCG
jgi:hypothetical protein